MKDLLKKYEEKKPEIVRIRRLKLRVGQLLIHYEAVQQEEAQE